MIDEKAFLETLNQAIDSNRLLPTLPEVAIQVRNAVERENSTSKEVADIITTDTALSARLLQVANSPLYRGRVQIESVQMAVTRLGVRLVRSLVVSLIMQQIFQATSDLLDKRFRAIWEESVQVAAISRVLAQSLSHLDKEQALLAGLIHNIGALPVLTMAEQNSTLIDNEEELDRVINAVSPIVGTRILQEWDFSEGLIKVPQHFQDPHYDGGSQADYVDLVIAARLQRMMGEGELPEGLDLGSVPALAKVGLEPEVQVIEIEGFEEEMIEVEHILIS
jgi:HD-like signal output (HDOD) protein